MTMKQTSASRIRGGWSPDMEKRAVVDEAKQVKCLISSEGHVWMRDFFDRLPKLVRQRLAASPHNICSGCVWEETMKVTRHPGVTIYFTVIERIERQLAAAAP
jgi:hypothetical protein